MASKILHLPEYCNVFKEFLVEELVFYESPLDFHHGKCSVIGRLFERNNLWYLQNITLDCVDKEYQLPSGAMEILLVPTSYHANSNGVSTFQNLNSGWFYEVYGETGFYNQCDEHQKPFTVAQMIIKLRIEHMHFDESMADFEQPDIPANACTFDVAAVQRDIERIGATFVPCIQVHTSNPIEQPAALVQTNLQLRLIRQRRRQKNY